jgi:hypothetical protein
MNEESIYWLFSSSAQSISTFVAFLLAGFAIVLQLMDSAEDRDETLQPIHQALKHRYHKIIMVLCVLTGLSIITSLGMTYLNGLKLPWIGWPSLIVFLLNSLVIILGIWFVTLIIDPAKYMKAADQMIAEETKIAAPAGTPTNRTAFFDSFINLEKDLREYIIKNKLATNYPGRLRIDYSFRQMIEILRRAEIIDLSIYERLQDINKMRNLIFHGHTQTVSTVFVKLIQNIQNELNKILRKKKTSRLTRHSS